MKLTVLTIVFLLIATLPLRAQQQTTGQMTYTTRLRPATISDPIPSTLSFNGNESVIESERQKGKPKRQPDATNSVITPELPQTSIVYKNITTKQLISRENAEVEMVIVDDTLKPIAWKIGTETRKIGQFTCQKAQATVRGRLYTAWFTPKIAVSTGPWKLYGLPGLILEAEDSTGEVRFGFESLTIPAPANTVISPPVPEKGQKRMNRYQLKAYTAQKFETIRKMLESKPAPDGVDIRIDIGKPKLIETDI